MNNSVTKNTFHSTLREMRMAKGLTQKELAAHLLTSQRNISFWESGNEPDIDTLWLIADFFDVSVDVLIGRREY